MKMKRLACLLGLVIVFAIVVETFNADLREHIYARGRLVTALDFLEGIARVGTNNAGFKNAPWAMSSEEWEAMIIERREVRCERI